MDIDRIQFMSRTIIGLKSALLEAEKQSRQFQKIALNCYMQSAKFETESLKLKTQFLKMRNNFIKEKKELETKLIKIQEQAYETEKENVNLNFIVKELRAFDEQKTKLLETLNEKEIKCKSSSQLITDTDLLQSVKNLLKNAKECDATKELKRCVRKCERKELAALSKCLEGALKENSLNVNADEVKFEVTIMDSEPNSPATYQNSTTNTDTSQAVQTKLVPANMSEIKIEEVLMETERNDATNIQNFAINTDLPQAVHIPLTLITSPVNRKQLPANGDHPQTVHIQVTPTNTNEIGIDDAHMNAEPNTEDLAFNSHSQAMPIHLIPTYNEDSSVNADPQEMPILLTPTNSPTYNEDLAVNSNPQAMHIQLTPANSPTCNENIAVNADSQPMSIRLTPASSPTYNKDIAVNSSPQAISIQLTPANSPTYNEDLTISTDPQAMSLLLTPTDSPTYNEDVAVNSNSQAVPIQLTPANSATYDEDLAVNINPQAMPIQLTSVISPTNNEELAVSADPQAIPIQLTPANSPTYNEDLAVNLDPQATPFQLTPANSPTYHEELTGNADSEAMPIKLTPANSPTCNENVAMNTDPQATLIQLTSVNSPTNNEDLAVSAVPHVMPIQLMLVNSPTYSENSAMKADSLQTLPVQLTPTNSLTINENSFMKAQPLLGTPVQLTQMNGRTINKKLTMDAEPPEPPPVQLTPTSSRTRNKNSVMNADLPQAMSVQLSPANRINNVNLTTNPPGTLHIQLPSPRQPDWKSNVALKSPSRMKSKHSELPFLKNNYFDHEVLDSLVHSVLDEVTTVKKLSPLIEELKRFYAEDNITEKLDQSNIRKSDQSKLEKSDQSNVQMSDLCNEVPMVKEMALDTVRPKKSTKKKRKSTEDFENEVRQKKLLISNVNHFHDLQPNSNNTGFELENSKVSAPTVDIFAMLRELSELHTFAKEGQKEFAEFSLRKDPILLKENHVEEDEFIVFEEVLSNQKSRDNEVSPAIVSLKDETIAHSLSNLCLKTMKVEGTDFFYEADKVKDKTVNECSGSSGAMIFNDEDASDNNDCNALVMAEDICGTQETVRDAKTDSSEFLISAQETVEQPLDVEPELPRCHIENKLVETELQPEPSSFPNVEENKQPVDLTPKLSTFDSSGTMIFNDDGTSEDDDCDALVIAEDSCGAEEAVTDVRLNCGEFLIAAKEKVGQPVDVEPKLPRCYIENKFVETKLQSEPSYIAAVEKNEKPVDVKSKFPKFYVENKLSETKDLKKYTCSTDEVLNKIREIQCSLPSLVNDTADLISYRKSMVNTVLCHRGGPKNRNKKSKVQQFKRIKHLLDLYMEESCKNYKSAIYTFISSVRKSDRTAVSYVMAETCTDSVTRNVRNQKRVVSQLLSLSFEIEKQVFNGFTEELKETIKYKILSRDCTMKEGVNGYLVNCMILLSRLYTEICKLKNDADSVINFMYESLMSLKFRSHPVAYSVLSVWPDVFHFNVGKNMLVELILFSLVHHKMLYNTEMYKAAEVQSLVGIHYKMKLGMKTAEEYAKEIMLNIFDKFWIEALALLCKRQQFLWAYTNVVMKYLLPILRQCKIENFDEIIVLRILQALQTIMASCPKKGTQRKIYNINAITSTLNSLSEMGKEMHSKQLKKTITQTLRRLS